MQVIVKNSDLVFSRVSRLVAFLLKKYQENRLAIEKYESVQLENINRKFRFLPFLKTRIYKPTEREKQLLFYKQKKLLQDKITKYIEIQHRLSYCTNKDIVLTLEECRDLGFPHDQ